jgi:uncharacterized Rossmann fold enzyme
MNLKEKLQLHRRIVATFRFSPYKDFLSGMLLNSLLRYNYWSNLPHEEIVSVIGPSNPGSEPEGYVIVADSALNYYRGRYDMIVSDLDGPVEKIISDRESIKVIHAHGDNIDLISSNIPKIPGIVLGTTQSIPIGRVMNIGGFTDGDRSVLMAKLLGAKKVYIHGFDFSNPVDSPPGIKLEKLKLAKEIIGNIEGLDLTYIRE